jgi:7-keto-8-aminopelargonate synthetase-like enzyme
MRSQRGVRHERYLRLAERHIGDAVDAGVCRLTVSDDLLAGESITINGERLVNFGSCAYLGLNTDPRLKAGAIAALERYGPVFSSSAAYTSVDLYEDLRDRLEQVFDASVILPTTTTLGHLSALPVLVGLDDLVLVDIQTHASVQMATQLLKAENIPVKLLPHNDVAAIERAVTAAAPLHHRVWYLADGVYSMLGDVAPVREVAALMERFDNLHAYYDDAHGFGWKGRHGRGFVLDTVPLHDRMVVAVSLAKSFGTGGAAIVFPDPEQARRVMVCGGTMTFSGPIHPAELGAAVASADIHLSGEQEERQARLVDQIGLVRSSLVEARLPVPALEPTPIWFVSVGDAPQVIELTTRLMAEGFYVNPSAFPAVPMGRGGIRFTNTLYHSTDQIGSLIDAISRHLPQVVDDEPDITIDLRSEVKLDAGVAEGAAAS